jgi:hypothetical protein
MILRRITIFVWALSMLMCVERISAQSGNAGSVEGTVKDPSGAAVGRGWDSTGGTTADWWPERCRIMRRR